MGTKSSAEPNPTWKSFLVEMLIYSALIVTYFYFALHYLGDWFKELYDHSRTVYAVVALLIMIGQTVGLQIICSFLMWAMREATGKRKSSRK